MRGYPTDDLEIIEKIVKQADEDVKNLALPPVKKDKRYWMRIIFRSTATPILICALVCLICFLWVVIALILFKEVLV